MDRKDPLKISLITLGCKTNQTDAASLAAELAARGHEIVSSKEKADAFVIHTCTVTQKTDYQARQAIRQAVARNPEAKIVVTGCYAEVSPEAIQNIAGVDYVVQPEKRNRIPEILLSGGKQKNARLLSSDRQVPRPLSSKSVSLCLRSEPALPSRCRTAAIPSVPTASSPGRAAETAACLWNAPWRRPRNWLPPVSGKSS